MPADLSREAVEMLTSGAIVAAVALPVGLICWGVARRRSTRLLPPWKPWRVPWSGIEVLAVVFLVLTAVVPITLSIALKDLGFFQWLYGNDLADVGILRELWARSLALPVYLGLLYLSAKLLYPEWRMPRGLGWVASVALGVAAWCVLTPVVLGFNFLLNLLLAAFDLPPDAHDLTKFVPQLSIDRILFLFQVSVAAPLIEEVVFRGVVLAWILGGRKPRPLPDVPTARRAWLVIAIALLFAVLAGRPGPVVFLVLLIVGQFIVFAVWHSKRRTTLAIYSSAALFASVHSMVWPSPVPLFFLGLGLGWLAVRTRGVLVPAIVHGLFNAVSGVFVLRGCAG